MISGVITILANFMFIFIIDSFTTIQWADKEGNYYSIKIDPAFLFLMALAKIIGSGWFIYKQGKGTAEVFKPILK